MKKNIETGQRFGRLVIVKEVEHHKMPSGRYRRMFLCKCDCGNEVTCSLANLTSGNTSSCGCLKRETASNNNSTHRQSKTRLYRCWQHMKHRCYREDNENYSYYGGRGIIMCDEWKDSYENFSKWAIDNGYKDNLTIDRIDCDGNYEPSNCRWITQKEQTRNTRRNTFVYLEGKGFSVHKFTFSELCEILKVNYPLSVKRIYQYIKKRKAIELSQSKVTKTSEQVWSEEDEHRVGDTIYFLETAKKHYASDVELNACIDWLKSLKDRI